MKNATTDTLPSEKKATINDVALASGFTKATVSMVMSNKGNISSATRQRVRRVARRLNYIPNPHAQRLSNGRCENTIALLSFHMDLGVGTLKLQIIQRLLADQGYEIPAYVYGYCAPDEFKYQHELMASLCRQKPKAIVCDIDGLFPETVDELHRFQADGGIVVAYDYPTTLQCDKVLFDRVHNTYTATRHLLDLGHRDIGLCRVGPPSYGGPRREGFCKALAEFGIEIRDEWCFGSVINGFGKGMYEEAGVTIAQDFLKLKKRPTALCVVDDSIAVGCAAELGRAGWRVPEDISIIGHDDTNIARYGVLPLTTVVHPTEAIARQVIDLLMARIEAGPETPFREVVLRGDLVVRNSTALPKART